MNMRDHLHSLPQQPYVPRRCLLAACRWLVLAVLVCLVMVGTGQAYNHDQHQGIVALGYKAMAAAVLERGCPVPVYFPSGPPASLRTYPAGSCDGEESVCQARWAMLLTDLERAIDFFHRTSSSLLAPTVAGCPDPRAGTNTLGEVKLAVDRYYNRDDGPDRDFCGIPPEEENSPGCSAPLHFCHPRLDLPFPRPGRCGCRLSFLGLAA